jgi:hypothetical protein
MKILEPIKDLFLVAISILTLSGFSYQIGFWWFFDTNGLSFIGISNIFKSAILPILNSLIYSSIVLTPLIYFFYRFKSDSPEIFIRNFSNVPKKRRALYLSLSVLTAMIGLILYKFLGLWEAFSLPASLLILLFLDWLTHPFFIKSITLKRTALIFSMLYFPIVSFLSGITNALLIKNNVQYSYIVSPDLNKKFNLQNDSIKFLANAESEYIFTDFKNQTTIVIHSEKADTLSLRYFSKPRFTIRVGDSRRIGGGGSTWIDTSKNNLQKIEGMPEGHPGIAPPKVDSITFQKLNQRNGPPRRRPF